MRAVKESEVEAVEAVDRVRWWEQGSMQSFGRSGWLGTESSKRCKKLARLLKLRLRCSVGVSSRVSRSVAGLFISGAGGGAGAGRRPRPGLPRRVLYAGSESG